MGAALRGGGAPAAVKAYKVLVEDQPYRGATKHKQAGTARDVRGWWHLAQGSGDRFTPCPKLQ